MSLYLGNLSSRVRRDDLERVFRRFGRNTIQIKDGYGFVVYEVPANAEKALRALRGKDICGERISITWSNKQPKPIPRFARGSRCYEPYNRRKSKRRGDYAVTEEESLYHERGFTVTWQPDGEAGRPHMDDFIDKEKDYLCDDPIDQGGEKHDTVIESFDGGLPKEPNLEDCGRWGEPVSGLLAKKEAENGAELDLYEPYHGYERSDEDEYRYRASPCSSSARGSLGEKLRKDRTVSAILKDAVDSTHQLKCYVCGLTGHIRRNCPHRTAFRQEKFTQLDHHGDSNVSIRVKGRKGRKRFTPISWGRSHSTGSSLPSRPNRRGRNSLSSKKPPKLSKGKSTPLAEGRESQRKKKRKREDRNSVEEVRKTKRDGLSSQRSDFTASSSWLSSSSSGTKSHSGSRSRSASSRTHSVSSSSKSVSVSSKSRSENTRSRSRSVSSASLSLSVSLSQPLRSSPSKTDVDVIGTSPKSALEEDNRFAPNQFLSDQRQLRADDANTENSKLTSTNGLPLGESRLPFTALDDKVNINHHGELHGGEHLELDKNECKVNGPCLNPLEKDTVSIDNLASKDLGERKNLQTSGSPGMEDTQLSYEIQDAEEPSKGRIKNSTSICPQEMHMVLKHYGLTMPNENEENLSLETYFGSARLLPWEIIYYRRLKKGPISIENYARRVAQNEEFGIVDRYIRSSSGWGECEQGSY